MLVQYRKERHTRNPVIPNTAILTLGDIAHDRQAGTRDLARRKAMTFFPLFNAGRNPNLKAGSIWQHRKGGLYTVLTVMAGEVGYIAHKDLRPWRRPVEEFLDGRFTEMDPPEIGTDAAPMTLGELGYERG